MLDLTAAGHGMAAWRGVITRRVATLWTVQASEACACDAHEARRVPLPMEIRPGCKNEAGAVSSIRPSPPPTHAHTHTHHHQSHQSHYPHHPLARRSPPMMLVFNHQRGITKDRASPDRSSSRPPARWHPWPGSGTARVGLVNARGQKAGRPGPMVLPRTRGKITWYSTIKWYNVANSCKCRAGGESGIVSISSYPYTVLPLQSLTALYKHLGAVWCLFFES